MFSSLFFSPFFFIFSIFLFLLRWDSARPATVRRVDPTLSRKTAPTSRVLPVCLCRGVSVPLSICVLVTLNTLPEPSPSLTFYFSVCVVFSHFLSLSLWVVLIVCVTGTPPAAKQVSWWK